MLAQRHQSHMISLQQAVDEAIAFIRENEPPEGYYVGFSGGKDSIVMLELTRMSGVKHEAYYSATGIDPPEVVRFIRKHYSEVKWLRPKMSFWQGIKLKSPPLRMQRWCCDVLKKDPGKAIPLPNRLMGIRAEESTKRAARGRIDRFRKYHQTIYKPIFGWKEWHIWEFIEANSLPYPSLYDEGFHRIGCVVCPFLFHKNESNFMIHKTRWPGLFKTFEHACQEWWTDRSRRVPDQNHVTFEEWLKAYYRGFE